MKPKHLRNGDSAAEALGDREIQLRRVCVREFMEAERRLVAKYPSRPVAPITRPEPPEDGVRALGSGKAGQSIDSAVFPNPIAHANVIDAFAARVAQRRRLLRCEVATLRFRKLVELHPPFVWRGRH